LEFADYKQSYFNLFADAIKVKKKESDNEGHFVPAGAGEVDVSISVPVQGVSQITVTVTSQVDFNYHVWRAIFVKRDTKEDLDHIPLSQVHLDCAGPTHLASAD
jgi:hypothetical protein